MTRFLFAIYQTQFSQTMQKLFPQNRDVKPVVSNTPQSVGISHLQELMERTCRHVVASERQRAIVISHSLSWSWDQGWWHVCRHFCMPGLSYFSVSFCPKRQIPNSTTAELRKKDFRGNLSFQPGRQRAGSLYLTASCLTVRAIPLSDSVTWYVHFPSMGSLCAQHKGASTSQNPIPYLLPCGKSLPSSGSSSTVGYLCEEAGQIHFLIFLCILDAQLITVPGLVLIVPWI